MSQASRSRRAPVPSVPAHVAIVGLGPSSAFYLDLAKRNGGRRAIADETWGINALGDVLACDRVFHMDDVRVQEIRAASQPKSNIAQMLAWMRGYRGPIYTSQTHLDYPCLVEYPLRAVIDHLGFPYFNSTAAYAVAFAVHLGVKRLSLWGIDFTYPNAHDAEKGRGCVEFWLGFGAARGMEILVAPKSALMDTIHSQGERVYGYDAFDLKFGRTKKGRVRVVKTPKALPSAEDIEARYDHSRHPNERLHGEK